MTVVVLEAGLLVLLVLLLFPEVEVTCVADSRLEPFRVSFRYRPWCPRGRLL